jgi:large subunit ribosomal protein L17
MRHKVAIMHLARDSEHRRAMMRNLAAGLFISGRIKTTLQKAKFVRPFVENLITTAKEGTLAARRRCIASLQDRFIVDKNETDVKRDKSANVVKAPTLIKKLFNDIAPKYATRPGGYTRIIKLSQRRIGDNGELVYLELIDSTQEKVTSKKHTGGNRRQKTQKRVTLLNKLLKGEKKETAKETKEVKAEETPKAE